ncbi:fructose-bisphosphate aldolase-lysine N-methyltransferase, chloroplastic isoform X2 [Magnolia sinica]|uniref:fructose-bisphosphate aldolase-lysine N-methyltransferase, chloroplastic isoform X2 n=1 Tax=Magnolia sinica TaxID=86752 RepID=UPI002659FF34|nr:fructose-bisphosphate aldolase-lysine N-methyltransferase, chloroplastic isoform X2 [Magnolia sinica]
MASSLCFLSSLSSSSLLYSAKCLKPRTLVRPTKAFSVNALSSPDDHYSPSASSPALQNFWQWLCEKGLLSDSSPAVKPGVVAEGLGLVAQRDISRNEVVVQVPKKLWINPDSVAASDIGRVCSGLKPWISVALFLLHNKSRLDSQWRPYLDILPHTTNSTIFCAGQKRSFQSYKINHSSSITSEEIAWEIKGTGLFSRELVFSLRSPVSVKAGEQVLIQYDLQKSNAELALDYGFIESSSDREAYTLTLEISESDPFFDDKLDIAESNGLGETAYFDIVLGRTLPPAMLPFLRLVALGGTDAFLLESIFRNSVWGHLELPVSRANEELICQVVRDACKSALSGYFTSVEEDEKLMEAGNLDPRLEIAVGIRAGEKKVLHQIDKIFEEREMELDGLEYYQERRLKDLGLVGEQGEIIFWESK